MKMKQKIIGPDDINEAIPFEGGAYAVGIQATPGTKFYFNNNNDNLITMGPSGIYQLNFSTPTIGSIIFTTMVGSLPIILDYIQEDQNNA